MCPNSAPVASISKSRGPAFPRTTSSGFAIPGTALDLIELAAIAIAGLALFAAGGHQIRDVALRGTSAHYLVDADGHLLEVAGRSRRIDFDAAWQVRWERLLGRPGSRFYVCVCEFESPSARLAFA